jgi:hypothetical protein
VPEDLKKMLEASGLGGLEAIVRDGNNSLTPWLILAFLFLQCCCGRREPCCGPRQKPNPFWWYDQPQ